MAILLFETKLYIPRLRSDVVPRPRPIERLHAGLSLHASDNDVARFFSYLIAALQPIDLDIDADLQPILESEADPPVEPLLTALVNDIAATCGRRGVGSHTCSAKRI